jgi:hypothetical protein
MLGLLVAAVAGGLAGYYWRDTIRDYMSSTDLRQRAAEGLGSLGERAGDALDRARTRIDAGVRSSQARLRSTGTTGSAEPQSAPGFGSGRGTGASSEPEHRR